MFKLIDRHLKRKIFEGTDNLIEKSPSRQGVFCNAGLTLHYFL